MFNLSVVETVLLCPQVIRLLTEEGTLDSETFTKARTVQGHEQELGS